MTGSAHRCDDVTESQSDAGLILHDYRPERERETGEVNREPKYKNKSVAFSPLFSADGDKTAVRWRDRVRQRERERETGR